MIKVNVLLTGVVACVLMSCGGGNSNSNSGVVEAVKSNGFFGDLPNLTTEMLEPQKELAALEKKSKDITTEKELGQIFEKAMELNEKIKQKESEMEPKIKEYFAGSGLVGTELPFEVSPAVDRYSVKSIKIKELKGDWLVMTVDFDLLKPTEKFLKGWEGYQIYFNIVDASGKTIFTDPAYLFNIKDYKEGETSQVLISFSYSQISQLGDFAKMVAVTHEEYNKARYRK